MTIMRKGKPKKEHSGKKWNCAHRGLGQYCHRCDLEAKAKAMYAEKEPLVDCARVIGMVKWDRGELVVSNQKRLRQLLGKD